jgi:hypothetical protein
VLLAPLAWILGELMICFPPVVCVVERTPVEGLPERPVTVAEVAALNWGLADCGATVFKPSPAIVVYQPELVHAVPTKDGGLELLHIYPAMCWKASTPEADAQEVLQRWLAEINQKGESR